MCGYIPGRKNSEDKTRSQETQSWFREQLASRKMNRGPMLGRVCAFFLEGCGEPLKVLEQ